MTAPARTALLALAASLAAALPCAGQDKSAPAKPAPGSPRVSAPAPVLNFRLPVFTPEGHRHAMLRAGEARLPDATRVNVREMELTLFNGLADEKIDSMLAAPSASFFADRLFAYGAETVRLERPDLTLTGADWSYDHQARKIVINRQARLVFHAPLGDILK